MVAGLLVPRPLPTTAVITRSIKSSTCSRWSTDRFHVYWFIDLSWLSRAERKPHPNCCDPLHLFGSPTCWSLPFEIGDWTTAAPQRGELKGTRAVHSFSRMTRRWSRSSASPRGRSPLVAAICRLSIRPSTPAPPSPTDTPVELAGASCYDHDHDDGLEEFMFPDNILLNDHKPPTPWNSSRKHGESEKTSLSASHLMRT